MGPDLVILDDFHENEGDSEQVLSPNDKALVNTESKGIIQSNL